MGREFVKLVQLVVGQTVSVVSDHDLHCQGAVAGLPKLAGTQARLLTYSAFRSEAHSSATVSEEPGDPCCPRGQTVAFGFANRYNAQLPHVHYEVP